MGSWPSGSPSERKGWLAFVSGGLALLIFLRSLAPGVLSYDFAEFQYLPSRLGLPHPNGFPFYMLLGWLWSRIPIGSLAFRMNLLSAIAGSITVAVFSLLLKELTGQSEAALAGAFFLALSHSFRFYSSGAERYTLLMLLLFVSFFEGLRWEKWGQPRDLLLSSLSLGLALATHPVAFLFLPFWLFYVTFARPHQLLFRPLLQAVSALLLPMALYLYIPWRWAYLARYPLIPGVGVSEAVYRGLAFSWYQPELTFQILREYIFGLGHYGFGMLKGGWKEALISINSVQDLWLKEFPFPLWPLAILGCLEFLRKHPGLWFSLTGFAGFDLLFTVYIRQGKPEAYLLPAFGVFALWLGSGLGLLTKAWERFKLPGWILRSLVVLLLLGFSQSADHDPTIQRFAGVEDWWREVLTYPVEEGSALMAHWGDLTPLWYFQQAEGIRPDLLGLYPPESGLAFRWLSGGKPLYLAGPTHGFDPNFPFTFRIMPWGKLLRIFPPGTNPSCPEGLASASGFLEWPLTVKGWRFSQDSGLLEVCWEASRDFPASLHLSVRVFSPGGLLILQKDEPLLPAWYPYSQVGVRDKGLFITALNFPEGIAPGNYRIELALFTFKGDSWEQLGPVYALGEIPIAHSTSRRRESDRTLLLKPRAGPFQVVAFKVSEKPVRPGDPVRLEVIWEAIEPPEADYYLVFRIKDARGLVKTLEPQPLSPDFPTSRWSKGEKVRVFYSFTAPRRISGRAFWAEPAIMSLRGEERWEWFAFHAGPFFMRDRPHLWKLPDKAIPVGKKFGEIAELAGYILEEAEGLKLTLYWKALNETDNSYHVFTHVVDEEGHLVAQHDGIPSGGAHPTSIWIRGEIIEDQHVLPMELPPGHYTILVGLYDPRTMERLKVDASENALPLVTIER